MAVTVPDWADTLLDVIGVNWPNVDEDAYRDMADSLREFAEDLEDDGHLANQHVQRLLSSGYGEAIDALNGHWGKVKDKHIKDIAGAARTIAGALDNAATAIEAMKYAALVHLGVLAGKAGISMALIPVTGGLSMLLGAAAIAACQQAVRKVIKECMEEVVAYIVSAMTEPAVAALENMAADLAIQVAADALGLQNGVDMNQVGQAGKDGFKEGVQGAKDAMHLASAGGSPGPGPGAGKGVHIEHSEHDRAGTKLNLVSVGVHGKTAGKLTKARSHHGRTRGKDDIAGALDPVVDKAMEALGKATKEMGDHLGKKLPKAVKDISDNQKRTDQAIKDRLARENKDGGDGRDGGKGGTRPGGDRSKDSAHTKPDSLKDAKDDPRRNGIPLDKKTCENDPVDVATGEMTLPQTDLSLPGVLPLVLRRTHLSGYRFGQWFGRSWASTLDERIELDPLGGGAVWSREDGSLLVYPRLPLPDEPDGVLPLEGARLPLLHGDEVNGETTYRVTDPHSGLTRSFTGSPYNESSAYWLREIEDRNLNRITFTRRRDGSPTAVTHDGGYRVTLAVEEARVRELALRTPDGPVTVMRYGYDARGNLDAVINSSGRPLRFTYDADARITSWTDRNDSTFRYVYDSAGRVVRTIGPDGYLSSTFVHDVHGETGAPITRYTNSVGATKVFHFNDHLQVVAETDPLGNTTHQTFDRYDRLLSRTDALGRTTAYTYDDRGNLTRVDHPDGTAATVEYNELNQLASVTGPDGSTSRQEYDERGNPTLFTRPNGSTTRLTHGPRGQLTGVDDSLGALDRVHCDAAGLPLAVRGPLGAVTRYTRDAFGRATRITDPQGRTTELEWTVEGKLARRTDPDGAQQSWTYDGEGNCLVHTDAVGGETRFEYTHFDLVAARTAPDGARHEFAHDTELRLAAVTDPQGLTWSYEYDSAGRLTSETDFDGRTLTYAHDAMGRLSARTNGLGQTVRYERDSAGRVITKDADGAVTRFTYDIHGHLASAVSPDVQLSFVRDSSGRILREICNGRELANVYDETGRRLRRTTPSGAVSTWSFPADLHAELNASGHPVVFEFDESGRESTRRIGDTLAIEHAYDAGGRLTDQRVRGAGDRTLQHRTYTYRADGHLTSVDDQLGGRRRLELTREGRVTGVTAENWSERYAYDEAGNQTTASSPGGGDTDGPREYVGTRITRAGRVRYEHDAQGRVVLRQKARLSRKPDTWHYGWDAEDHLVSVTTPDGTRWRYVYDALGRRIAKQRLSADATTVAEEVTFTWDGDTLCEQTTSLTGSADSVALTWDHDGVKPVTQVERRLLDRSEVDRRFFAIVTDLVGTPRELVDEQGKVAWRTRATLWGTTTWNRSATAYTPLRFPGQYFDPESGLHYNRHRHYDPESGRYLSPDPLGLVPAPNAVTYVDNPTRWIDPLGLAGCPHRNGEHRHSVVLGVDMEPHRQSESLARYLRNDPSYPNHDPNRPQDPGAHTYNGNAYSGEEAGGPIWMTNVMAAVGDRNTTLSITLDGMPNSEGRVGNWSTPADIVDAFQAAAQHGAQFNTSHEDNYPRRGSGTAWEMSEVAYAVRNYDGAAAWGDPDSERPGRPWEEIHWYTRDEENGGYKEIKVPKPDIPEIQPDLSKLPKHLRDALNGES
ncbi:RHS repeat-associated core domain-containing protein [Streptomyces pristinaespiralis]|uniref:Type IV secretion protein Rhs n=1 Tax=Streptomyces pristinaespiralis TaxID=38300 RepID=A0A0M4D915_STRPR|nr:RHS repeat-associated core domain-containing protein [Streptomyces pristinaespiralis]ALC21052.1 type IV secretion protein Rhs [Streptomyces pristinaespiralis]